MKYYNNYPTEKRPWGKFEILVDSDNCKVKRITVYPGGRLSYQYHHKRSEVWTIVSGVATMTLNDKISDYIYGETILISQGTKHRVENKGLDEYGSNKSWCLECLRVYNRARSKKQRTKLW